MSELRAGEDIAFLKAAHGRPFLHRRSHCPLRRQQLRLPLRGQRVDDLVQAFSLHHPVERIEGQIDAVIGYALAGNVGVDALRSPEPTCERLSARAKQRGFAWLRSERRTL